MDNVAPTVKAVGFSFISPEVILIMLDASSKRLHFYPSASDGKSMDLSDPKPHWVLLKSPNHIGSMLSYADRIDRLIVFGRPDELLNLGLPILDATVTDGRVEVIRRSHVNEMIDRINKEAIDLSLAETEKIYQGLQKQERVKMKPQSSGKTFIQQLKELKASVTQAGNGLNFIQQIGVPTVLRLLGDTDREEFKSVCKLMVDKGGVPDTLARSFFRWVEGFEGEGAELGKAAEKLLYPKEGAAIRTEEAWQPLVQNVARKMLVDETDLEFVARSYYQLVQEREKVAQPEPKGNADDWDDYEGPGSSPEPQDDAFPEEQDDAFPEEVVGLPEDNDTEEPDDNQAEFGWEEKDQHPDKHEEEEEEEEEEEKDSGMFDDGFGDFSDFDAK